MADDDVPPTDVRDEALARALDVEPLDELSRRRLVSAALAEANDREEAEAPAQGTSRARVFGIAAAAVAFVVLGVAALTLPGGDTADVATRAPQSLSEQVAPTPTTAAAGANGSALATGAAPAGQSAATAADSGSASAKAEGALPDLGQLDDLSVAGSAARVVAAATPFVEGVAPQRWAFTFQQCAEHTFDVVATGLGSIDGHPVQVYVSRRPDGTLRVRALDGSTCKVRSLP